MLGLLAVLRHLLRLHVLSHLLVERLPIFIEHCSFTVVFLLLFFEGHLLLVVLVLFDLE